MTDSEGRVLFETTKRVDTRDFPNTLTVVEQDASLETREKLWLGMTYDLLKRLSYQLEEELSMPSFNEFVER